MVGKPTLITLLTLPTAGIQMSLPTTTPSSLNDGSAFGLVPTLLVTVPFYGVIFGLIGGRRRQGVVSAIGLIVTSVAFSLWALSMIAAIAYTDHTISPLIRSAMSS